MPHKMERLGADRRPTFAVFDGWTAADERALVRRRCDAVWIAGGRWADLSFLAGRSHIRELRIQAARCPDTSAIARLPGLTGLELIGSEVGNLPSAGELPKLEALYVEGWRQRQHAEIIAQPRLRTVRLSIAREFDTFRLLRGAPHLERLELEQSSLRSLMGIGELPRLRGLELAHPRCLRSLDGVAEARKLLALVVWGHRRCTVDITALAGARGLLCLALAGMIRPSDGIEPLRHLKKLQVVRLTRRLNEEDTDLLRSLPSLRHVFAIGDRKTLRRLGLPVSREISDEFDMLDFALSKQRNVGGPRG